MESLIFYRGAKISAPNQIRQQELMPDVLPSSEKMQMQTNNALHEICKASEVYELN